MMRRALLLLALLASPLAAQSDYTHIIGRVGKVEFMSHHPACNPFAMAFDPLTFDGRCFRQPRVLWHAEYAALNTGIDAALKAIHAPKVMRWPVVHLGLPLVPHLLQMRRDLKRDGVYQMNLYDWIYDFTAKQPIEVTKAAIARRVVLDVPLSCFARP